MKYEEGVTDVLINEGFHKDRLEQNNPREVAFSEAWKHENGRDMMRANTTISGLIPDCTKRDAAVAATVIQWLGSNIGMAFLTNVIRKSPEIRKWFGV